MPVAHGGGPAVQALQDVDVHDAHEAAVAAVPDDADGALHDVELLQHLQQDAQRDRLAAAGAERVLAEQQRRA